MTTLGQSLRLFEYAPVLAFTRGRRPGAEVTQHFTTHPDSTLALLATSTPTGAGPSRARAPRIYPRLGIVYGTVDREGLAALRDTPEVTRVTIAPQPSLIRPVARGSAPLRRSATWGIEAMRIPDLWAAGLTGAGVKVAHLDTGVDGGHPALAGAVTSFVEFDAGGLPLHGSVARDSDTRDGHGTHTAATIAGRPVKSRHVGLAPGAGLYAAMVIEGGDVIARILGGMEWAVGEGVQVLSMSLGIRGYVNDFLGIIDALRDNGVFPVVAVGNEGPGTSRSPGNYPRVLSVGYVTKAMAVADDSSSQRFPRRTQPLVPDIVAPGDDIVSAAAGGGWRTLSGSSMAAPHVAGLAALLLEAFPAATVPAMEKAILASAELGSLSADRANRGLIDSPRALAALTRTMTR